MYIVCASLEGNGSYRISMSSLGTAEPWVVLWRRVEVLFLWLFSKATAVCLSGCKQLFCDLLWCTRLRGVSARYKFLLNILLHVAPTHNSTGSSRRKSWGFFELSALSLSASLTATRALWPLAHVCVAHWEKKKKKKEVCSEQSG